MDNIELDDNLSYFSDNNEEVLPETQEICEPEPQPVVADYSNSEINEITNYVKKMTVLYMMNEKDWTVKCSKTVRAWLSSPTNVLLTIFYNCGVLTAILAIPTVAVYDLIYFLRDPNTRYTIDNFHDEVTFGRIHEDVEGTLLTLVDKVYAPIVLKSNAWSENTKSYLNSQFQAFLSNMTRVHFMLSGISVLYVPHQLLEGEGNGVEKDRLKQMESIAEHWISIFRTCLCDKPKISPYNSTNLCEEYDFWVYRYEVLCCVKLQVGQKDFKYIIESMEQAQSTFVKQIRELVKRIDAEIRITCSNVRFYKLFQRQCEELNLCASFSEASLKLAKLVNTIVFVKLNSAFLNSNEVVTELFSKLTNQLILFCQSKIDVEDILCAKPTKGITLANEAIDCCLYYKVIFSEILDDQIIEWELREEVIFNYLDMFVQRIYDFIEICQGMIVFEQKHDVEVIPRPLFGGVRGNEFENICENVKTKFTAGLSDIRRAAATFLDVHNYENGWPEQIRMYYKMVNCLEETIVSLIRNVFSDVSNVDEGIDALCGLYYYSLRTNVKDDYMKKTVQVWIQFANEITKTNKQLLDLLHTRNSQVSKFAGRGSELRTNCLRISRIKKLFEEAEWLPDYAYSGKILQECVQMETNMNSTIKRLYEQWLDQNRTEAISKLNRTLMIRSVTHPCLIECNISHSIFGISLEAHYFKILGFGIPVHINLFYAKHTSFKTVYDSVILLLVEYNRILISLSVKEHLLFRCLIQVCDSAFLPAIYRLTWNSDGLDMVIVECNRQIDDLKTLVKIYRKANSNITGACEDVCGMTLIQLEHKQCERLLFDNLISEFEAHRKEQILEMVRTQNFIAEALFCVLKGFEPHIGNMTEIWGEYVLKYDKLLLDALKICSRSSLEKIYQTLHYDGTTKQTFLLLIDINLQGKKLILSPSMERICHFFGNIHMYQVDSISHIPRLTTKIGVSRPQPLEEYAKMIENDEECKHFQQLIQNELGQNKQQMNDYMKQWIPFAAIWELDKDTFMQKFTQLTSVNPTSVLLSNLERYADILNQIFFREITTTINCLLIDCTNLKKSLYDEMHNWCVICESADDEKAKLSGG